MYDLVSIAAFRDEMTKLAQNSAQRIDPQAIELQQALEGEQSSKELNRRALTRFLGDTAAVALGSGAGYGLGRLTLDALGKVRPPKSGFVRGAILAGIPLIGGGAALALRGKMREEQNRRLEEAYQHGLLDRGVQ